MIRWVRTGTTIKDNGERTIVYQGINTPYQIECRRRLLGNKKNNSMRLSTSYFVVKDGEELAEKFLLRDAKGFVENLRKGEKA